MTRFEVHQNGRGWRVHLPDGAYALQATGAVSESGSVRATVELWRLNGAAPSLVYADEAVLTKEKARQALASALSTAAGQAIPAGALLALAQAIRATAQTSTAENDLQGRPLMLADPEPWHEPVNGAELADTIASVFQRFVALPEGAAEALALWVVHTHALEASEISPRLALVSPTKRCGKTTTLTILGRLVARPLPAANITPAALFRVVEAHRPTVLIDEADTIALHDNHELRGLLNAGHYRPIATAIRTVGEKHEARAFTVWAPVAIAMIGRLPSTLEDRAIVIRMRRRRSEESVERLALHRLEEFAPLQRMAARWARDQLEHLCAADPEIPDSLHDRAADNWRPLLAIADALGAEWPQRARGAALTLSGGSTEDEEDAAIALLADLKAIFEEEGEEFLTTATLLDKLHEMEDRPWGDWRGRPLSAHGLARLLRPFGIAQTRTYPRSQDRGPIEAPS
ncbi:MAG: hypothetical protein C4292_02510, partial [Nitrososphaera sp.]